MTQTVALATAIMKRLYPQRAIQAALYKNGPLLGMVPKSTKFTGEDMRIAVQIAPTKGRSATFATAQANVAGNTYRGFNLTRVRDYSIMQVETEFLQASADDEGALVRGLRKEMDGAINAFSRSLSAGLYGNAGGALGQVGSTNLTVLTLLRRESVVNFEVGMRIDSDDTDGTAGGAPDGDPRAITAIDRNLGTLTTTANWTGAGNYANNDYLFAEGDFGLKCSGLASWIPPTAPGATPFFGVDRTADSQRLSGIRFAADSDVHGTIENALIDALSEGDIAGAEVDAIFMNPKDHSQFERELGDKRQYTTTTARTEAGSMVTVGYKGISLNGASRLVAVHSDRDCPRHRAYALTMESWVLKSLNQLPQWLDDDGAGQILRVHNADAYQGRLGGFFQLGCDAPWKNITIDLSELTA